ncbi:MAG: hypothetical protein M0R75_08145 [Dehalococcoidia bacterium]|jgi:hypothetical protein|nr:hypothetical protein [Dehalococcoidia bacterium]
MRYDDEHEDDDRLDGWVESTEGDLDPDLTEEAGYLAWDPPQGRDWLPLVGKLAAAAVIVAMIGVVVLPVVT